MYPSYSKWFLLLRPLIKYLVVRQVWNVLLNKSRSSHTQKKINLTHHPLLFANKHLLTHSLYVSQETRWLWDHLWTRCSPLWSPCFNSLNLITTISISPRSWPFPNALLELLTFPELLCKHFWSRLWQSSQAQPFCLVKLIKWER